jgi:hypothetical protein
MGRSERITHYVCTSCGAQVSVNEAVKSELEQRLLDAFRAN